MELATALSAVKLIARGSADVDLISLGISVEDLELTTIPRPWLGQEKHIVIRTLNALANGALDALGLPTFELPAEYYAGIIATVVDPVNIHAACSWINLSRSAEDIQNGSHGSSQTVSKLFSMVCQLANANGSQVVRQRFRAKFDLALENAGGSAAGEGLSS